LKRFLSDRLGGNALVSVAATAALLTPITAIQAFLQSNSGGGAEFADA